MSRQKVLVPYNSTGIYLSLLGRLFHQLELEQTFWLLHVLCEQRACSTLALLAITCRRTSHFHFYCSLCNSQTLFESDSKLFRLKFESEQLIQNNFYFNQNAFTYLPLLSCEKDMNFSLFGFHPFPLCPCSPVPHGYLHKVSVLSFGFDRPFLEMASNLP